MSAAFKYMNNTTSEVTVTDKPALLVGFYINGASGAGAVVFRNGPAGEVVIYGHTGYPTFQPVVPILFPKGIYVTPGNASIHVSVFYV